MKIKKILGYVFLYCLLNPLAVLAVDQNEDLAGEVSKAKPNELSAKIQEPERQLAGANQAKPTLKLPEVVIKGERNYKITSERKDLLLIDPMQGTKEVPADIDKIVIPGLDNKKGVPQAETITAKNHLIDLEISGGNYKQLLGNLIFGYQWPQVNFVFKTDYQAVTLPLTYQIEPSDQNLNANLDFWLMPFKNARIFTGITTKAASHLQPYLTADGWGKWLEQMYNQINFSTELNLNLRSTLKIKGDIGKFYQQGVKAPIIPKLTSEDFNAKLEFEQNVSGLLRDKVNLCLGFEIKGQKVITNNIVDNLDVYESLQKIILKTHLRPIDNIYIDLGVNINNFRGLVARTNSNIIAQTSLVLPWGAILYAETEGGMKWQTVSEWYFEHPRPAVNSLPKPERILEYYKIGWRHTWGDNIYSDVTCFKKRAMDTTVWLDNDGQGIFSLYNLPNTYLTGLKIDLEFKYTRYLWQKFTYLFRQIDKTIFPYLPRQEIKTTIFFEGNLANINLNYCLLGQRNTNITPASRILRPAHLVNLTIDFKLKPNLLLFLDNQNILGSHWERWEGYTEKGFSVLTGIKLNF